MKGFMIQMQTHAGDTLGFQNCLQPLPGTELAWSLPPSSFTLVLVGPDSAQSELTSGHRCAGENCPDLLGTG